VGEPATTGSASSSTLWQSPSGVLAASEPRVWYDEPRGTPRPPGRLLLNMLVRNEAENLARTLPKWAKIIDYWIIGVDEKNDDDSIEIIKRTLGHLPGEIALVRAMPRRATRRTWMRRAAPHHAHGQSWLSTALPSNSYALCSRLTLVGVWPRPLSVCRWQVKGFDGHGPTWTTLVEIGIKHYPGATVSPDTQSLDHACTDSRWQGEPYTSPCFACQSHALSPPWRLTSSVALCCSPPCLPVFSVRVSPFVVPPSLSTV